MARASYSLRILVLLFAVLFCCLFPVLASQEPQQEILGFNLSGFSEKGKSAWKILANSANIFASQIKLNQFVGKIYDQEQIDITADKGNFDKLGNKVHLEDDVVVTTESGTRLSTDYLDWDRKSCQVSTQAAVDIKRDNIVISGLGIKADTNLKSVDLERDISVNIENKKNTIVITCLGPLSIDYVKKLAVFHEQVSVDDGQFQISADLMEVSFESADDSVDSVTTDMSRIKDIVARGNVKIIRFGNSSFSDEAFYNAATGVITLTGRPRLVIFSDLVTKDNKTN